MKCKPPERTPQLGQNGLTNRAQDNKENEKRRLPTENAIEPYYSATTIATIAVASVVHDNWMRTCVQDNKRIQDNERIPCTKRETDTSCIPTTTITTEIKTETRTEITTEKTTEITSETTSETKKPHIRDLDLKKKNVHVPNDGDRATGRVNEKNEKIRQTDKSYLIMQLFICITRPERTILANYVQRSGPRCQAKHDGQRDQRSYDSTGWYDFQTSNESYR